MEKCLLFLKEMNFVNDWVQGLGLFEQEKKAEFVRNLPDNMNQEQEEWGAILL